jgi:hypothetical protein
MNRFVLCAIFSFGLHVHAQELRPLDTFDPTKHSCAETIILKAAKKNVADNYNNSPTSGGYCALGVRQSLQLSKVGGVQGGLGNAIDYLETLPPHDFVDSKLRDPNTAPAGAVIVFSGPNTDQYLKNGHFGSPPGDWLGHVTIKGDDKYYYTDGRTREPAIGWKNGKNTGHRRNIAAILVPDATLVAKYADKCATLELEELVMGLSSSRYVLASMFSAALVPQAFADVQSEVIQGPALAKIRSFNEIPARDSRKSAALVETLKAAREAAPYDEEGQVADALASALNADPAVKAEFDRSLGSLPQASVQDRCKTKLLASAVAVNLCRKTNGMRGQDYRPSENGHVPECGKIVNYDQCLENAGQR